MAVGKARRSWALVPAVAAVLLVLGSGCDGGGSQPPPTSSSQSTTSPTAASSATTTQDPKAAAASRSAVTAYQGYVGAFAAASQIPDPDYPGLRQYMNDPLLSRTRHELFVMRDRGVVQVGAQTATVTRTTVDVASAQPSVTIHACLDYSALKLVYKSDHAPVPNSEIKKLKVSAIATVWQYVNGQWLVNDSKDGTEPC